MIESLRSASLSSYNFGPLSIESDFGTNPQIIGTGEFTLNSPTSGVGYVNYNAAGEVQVRGTTSGDLMTLTRYSTTGGPSLNLRRSDTATIGASGTADSGDGLGNIFFEGHDSVTYASGAAIRAFAEENWSSTARGTNLRFYTVPNGSTTLTERMRIDAAGLISGSGTSLGAWAAWTPTVTQGVGITLTSNNSKYMQIGKLVVGTVYVSFSSAGTASSTITISVPPVTPASGYSGGSIGNFRYFDSGTAHYVGTATLSGTTLINLYRDNTGGALTSPTIASGDSLLIMFMYEAA